VPFNRCALVLIAAKPGGRNDRNVSANRNKSLLGTTAHGNLILQRLLGKIPRVI